MAVDCVVSTTDVWAEGHVNPPMKGKIRGTKRATENMRRTNLSIGLCPFVFIAPVSVVTYENKLSGYVSMVHLVDNIRSKEANEQ